ncbi:MAG TPA: DMT family transporter [Thermoanaerobaculia bacterium]|nr:DMT family transporter [Thermoanaerobaculia bacterium]
MSPVQAGQLAALGAATCWSFSALAFDAAARRIGPLTLNLLRLLLAFGFLTLLAWALRGVPLPVDASPRTWGWLAVSGLVGFVFGDFCLFRAFLAIGPRLSMLMMSLAPPLTAIIGWLLLGETLSGRDFAGMVLTVTGIAWAVLERKRPGETGEAGRGARARRAPFAGIFFGFCGALGQAGGLVLSKLGMGGYDAVAATQVRVVAGVAGYALLFLVFHWWPRMGPALRDGRALSFAAVGAFFGPCVGVSLSLYAVHRTVSGVAASLMALTPVLLIPLVVLLGRERVGIGGVAGSLVAVAGVALLFL